MQVIIGTTDVTSAVQETSYSVDRNRKFTSWTNANNVEVHSNIHYKIEGSFDMVFLPTYSMNYSDFLALINENTTAQGVTTLSLSVNNLDGQVVTINAYVDIEFKPMRELKNGSGLIFKKCKVTVQEC